MSRLLFLLIFCALASGCGGEGSKGSHKTLLVAVNAPFSRTPYVGQTIANGASLAGQGVTIKTREGSFTLRFRRYDSGLSARTAVANVRRAIADRAIAILDEGTGVNASWRLARDANVPIGIAFQGGKGLVDPDLRPNVFRIAPTDHGAAFRLAEYVIPKHRRIALIADDSDYGQGGLKALNEAFAGSPVAIKLTAPSGAPDLAPEILRARRAHADALIVWAEPATIAGALTAARGSGWNVPFYTPAAGEDPLVRQQLANHPKWVDGLTFAAGRPTAEVGAGPFLSFQRQYEDRFGVLLVGVKTPDGIEVVQPPDYAMYSYDFVNVLVAAIQSAGSVSDKEKIISAMEEVSVAGANGDHRGFNERNHDGVVDDDVYFAQFKGMTYSPVKDDPLSATLPVIDQRR